MIAKDTILIISTSFPFTRDGSEAAGAFVADFAEELSKFTPTRVVGPGSRESVEDGDIPVWRFAAGNKPLSLLSPANPLHWIAILRTLRSLRRQVSAACADHRVRHIIALWVLPSGWAARAVAREHDIDYSIWALGSDIWSIGKLPIVRSLLTRVANEARMRFADGLQLAKDAENLCNQPFEFLPSSRNLSGIRNKPIATKPPYRLLFIGRWHKNKGIDLLLESLETLNNNDWEKIEQVRIAGGGPMRRFVLKKIAELQSQKKPVVQIGYVNKAMAESELGTADWLVIPSRIESIPVVLSDAFQMMLPVISTNTGDMKALMANNEKYGVIANEISVISISNSIKTALSINPTTMLPALDKMRSKFSNQLSAKTVLNKIYDKLDK